MASRYSSSASRMRRSARSRSAGDIAVHSSADGVRSRGSDQGSARSGAGAWGDLIRRTIPRPSPAPRGLDGLAQLLGELRRVRDLLRPHPLQAHQIAELELQIPQHPADLAALQTDQDPGILGDADGPPEPLLRGDIGDVE